MAKAPIHHVPPTPRELRAQVVHRLQIGLFGLAAMLLLVGLANVILDRAYMADASAVADPDASASASTTPANDPLVDMGVTPNCPRPTVRLTRRRPPPRPSTDFRRAHGCIAPVALRRGAAGLRAGGGRGCGVEIQRLARGLRAGASALMLFTSLPILWNETPDLAAMLRADAPPHWARRALEARYTLVARDTLLAPPLDARFLLLAQPRPLAPQENVALDDWVRAGASAAVRRSDAHGGQHLCAGRPPPPAGHRAAFAHPRALGAGTALRRGSAGGRA
jgi:hypothetical protein